MAPHAQPSAEFHPDSKQNSSSNMAAGRGNSRILTDSRGKGLRCIKSEEAIVEMEVLSDEQTKGLELEEDIAVNVNEFTRSSDIRVPEVEDTDATEYSSSFADTISGNENCSGLSDAEVESQFYGDNGFASAFDDFNTMFPMRKKKLTSHWRSFIHPLMWRCKWTELRIKEFVSQAVKCDREISALDQRKQMGLDQFAVEGFGSRSLPYTFQGHRKKVMKRRKRKRVEDTIDPKSYMSNHRLFSYIGNKRSDPDGTSIADDLCNSGLADQTTTSHGEFGINSDWSFLEDKDNSLEQIFWKIEIVHSRVHKLKAQLDLVMSKTAGKFSSSENLSHLVPCDVQTSSVRSPTFSACNGDTMLMRGLYDPIHQISEYDLGDLVLPESAVSSFGEAIDIPDIIESTVGLLSSADVTQHYSQIGDSCEDILDNILIHNQVAEAETHTLINSNTQHEPEKIGEEESTINPVLPTLEPDNLPKNANSQEHATPKPHLASDFHFPKNKRKRGERKAGMGNWSRQCPGEPDSQ